MYTELCRLYLRMCACLSICLSINTFLLFFVAQSRPALCHPMDSSPPGSSIYGMFQARILEWVAISYYGGSFQPRGRTHVSCKSPALQADSLLLSHHGSTKYFTLSLSKAIRKGTDLYMHNLYKGSREGKESSSSP